MKFCPLFLLLFSSPCLAQSYDEEIGNYRQHYKEEFITEKNSPLKGNDTAFLRFYPPDIKYRVRAGFTATPDANPFDMPTYSGKLKPYRKYGELSMRINDTVVRLEVYQGLDLIKRPELKDHLFIPFRDLTNYVTTYGGGRYIDLRTGDIENGEVIIDFNKCYNPYCAYASGYSCPIPPEANKLKVAIPAGEQLFGKPHD